jgi:hypothetical protein
MWLARHFPGFGYRPEDVDELTPERTAAYRRVGRKLLDGESDERWAAVKVLVKAASSGVRLR